ncbi:alpha/beta fold hydrolase [Sphingomonas lacunae]|uniref:Alpha/beta fold hydrolase n=1 Tax=Sphingomonas lacunae TaxID=2698828 RepID=A0A6M4AV71_9SPHN|nr:alpha/beta fold hydrolase [Sphingomonas lacunae]QJQ33005.1 alpha/beta fold hydrolase [Sphingomonas lacunae]
MSEAHRISKGSFRASDGCALVWHEMGRGRPVILLHGLFSNANVNWIRFGTAARIVEQGYRVIMADLRAHGESSAPHDPACYPDDVLARDCEELIAHLGLSEFDLGGFSLGARTTVRAVVGGLRPDRVILGGMGLAGLAGWSGRRDFFLRAIDAYATARRGDDVWMAIQFMKTMKVDLVAARLLLGTFADTSPQALKAISMPTLVVCGADDEDNGSPCELVAALPDAKLATIPGTHMSSVTEPALGEAMAAFLGPPS